jgi:hypothetical protein
MVDVKERHLLELLPQHKANCLDKLDAFEDISEIQQLCVADVLVAGHLTSPQQPPLVTSSKDIDEEVKTRDDLNDVVDREKSFHLEGPSPLHESTSNQSSIICCARWQSTHLGPNRRTIK